MSFNVFSIGYVAWRVYLRLFLQFSLSICLYIARTWLIDRANGTGATSQYQWFHVLPGIPHCLLPESCRNQWRPGFKDQILHQPALVGWVVSNRRQGSKHSTTFAQAFSQIQMPQQLRRLVLGRSMISRQMQDLLINKDDYWQIHCVATWCPWRRLIPAGIPVDGKVQRRAGYWLMINYKIQLVIWGTG